MGWTVYYRVGSTEPFSPEDRAALDAMASAVTERLPRGSEGFAWGWATDHGVAFFRQIRPQAHMVGGFTKIGGARSAFKAFDRICSALRQLQRDHPQWEVLVHDDEQLLQPSYALTHAPVPVDDDAEQALNDEWAALEASGDLFEIARVAWAFAELGHVDRAVEMLDTLGRQTQQVAGAAFVEAAEIVLEHSEVAVDARALVRLKRAAVRGVRGPRLKRLFERALEIRPSAGSEVQTAFDAAVEAFEQCFGSE